MRRSPISVWPKQRLSSQCLCGSVITTHEGSPAYEAWAVNHGECVVAWRKRMTYGLEEEEDKPARKSPYPVHYIPKSVSDEDDDDPS